MRKKYYAWKGSFVCHYFNHLEDGEWVEISQLKYWLLKLKGYTVKTVRINKSKYNIKSDI